MILRIRLTSHKAELLLLKEDTIVQKHTFLVDTDLSKKIFLEMDVFFRNNGIDPLSLDRVECVSDSCGFTTERIGETVAHTYNYILESKTKK